MNVVGFTGTRDLTSAEDLAFVDGIVAALPDGTRVITGACIGVDAAVARSAKRYGLHVHTIVPRRRDRVDPDWRQWCDTFEEMPAGTTYYHRNFRIVVQSTELIAIPSHAEDAPESKRSGSWQTARIARMRGIPVDPYVLCGECVRRQEGGPE